MNVLIKKQPKEQPTIARPGEPEIPDIPSHPLRRAAAKRVGDLRVRCREAGGQVAELELQTTRYRRDVSVEAAAGALFEDPGAAIGLLDDLVQQVQAARRELRAVAEAQKRAETELARVESELSAEVVSELYPYYVELVREIHDAGVRLSQANDRLTAFFVALDRAGVVGWTGRMRPAQLGDLGSTTDNTSLISVWRREQRQHGVIED